MINTVVIAVFAKDRKYRLDMVDDNVTPPTLDDLKK